MPAVRRIMCARCNLPCHHGPHLFRRRSRAFPPPDRGGHRAGRGRERATLLVEDGDGFPCGSRQRTACRFPMRPRRSRLCLRRSARANCWSATWTRPFEGAQKDFDVKYRNPNATNMRKQDEHMEVDLHYHVLTVGQRLTARDAGLQMEHFDRMMRRAEESGFRDCVHPRGGAGPARSGMRWRPGPSARVGRTAEVRAWRHRGALQGR